MRRNYWGLIILCGIPAIICYYICRLYADSRLSAIFAVFTFVSLFTVFYIYMEARVKKFKNICIPDSRIRFMALATYYTNKLEGNGILLLTDKSLLFIKYKKREYIKTEIPLERIENAFNRTGAIARLQLKDGSAIEFMTAEHKAFLNELNSRI